MDDLLLVNKASVPACIVRIDKGQRKWQPLCIPVFCTTIKCSCTTAERFMSSGDSHDFGLINVPIQRSDEEKKTQQLAVSFY